MAKKAFSETFHDFETKSEISRVTDFINRNELSPADYQLVPISKGVDSSGTSIGNKLVCIYHAERKLS